MTKAAPEHILLVRSVLAAEAGTKEPTEATVQAATGVFEKLRLYLVKFVGVAGFQALAGRALALAKAETIWLAAVHVSTEGRFEGLGAATKSQEQDAMLDGTIVLLAQLLGLLVTFIGPALTLRMLRDIWPDGSFDAGAAGQDMLRTDVEERP